MNKHFAPMLFFLIEYFVSPFQFRVQFVCKSGGLYGIYGKNGQFLGLFVDEIDKVDTKKRPGQIYE